MTQSCRGYDKQTEADMARSDNFLANYEPLAGDSLAAEVEDVMSLDGYTPPLRELLLARHDAPDRSWPLQRARDWWMASRQRTRAIFILRPDIANPMRKVRGGNGYAFSPQAACGHAGVREHVDAVLSGRRNNPPDSGDTFPGGIQPHPLPGVAGTVHGLTSVP